MIRTISSGSSPFSIIVRYEITNSRDSPRDFPVAGRYRYLFGDGFDPIDDPRGGPASAIYGYRRPFSPDENHLSMALNDAGMEGTVRLRSDWIGFTNKLYVAAVRLIELPPGFRAAYKLGRSSDAEMTTTPFSLAISQMRPHPRAESADNLVITFEVVVAPKSYSVFNQHYPELRAVVLAHLWEWFRSLCITIGILVHQIYAITGNWCITLLAIAALVRASTYPISRFAMANNKRAADQRARIAPLVTEAKSRFEGLALSEAIIGIYDKEKYDHLLPFKAMLGILIQIPILIALFNVLAETPELRGAGFLWIDDLTISDRLFDWKVNIPGFGSYFNALPFVMSAVTILSTYHLHRKVDNGQIRAGTLFGMALFFFIMFYSFPAALILYWIFSNLLQLGEQIAQNGL